MESHHKAALAKCSLLIKKNITNIREVMDNLLQEDCLTWDERSKIGQEKAIDDQCQILLEILIRRGRNSYNSFISALKDTGNNHVVDEIEKAASKIGNFKHIQDFDSRNRFQYLYMLFIMFKKYICMHKTKILVLVKAALIVGSYILNILLAFKGSQ